MEFEEDFVSEEVVEFEIEGRKFKYKPTTAGNENAWVNEYIEIVDGKPVQNLAKLNECKIRNLIEVPYDKELINKIIQVNKEWKNLGNDEKWNLLSQLKPGTFDKIIINMNSIDNPLNEIKKN
jgi:hypothetical protein